MKRPSVASLIVAVLATGCHTNAPRERAGDYREDQATRMTAEDAQRNTQGRKRPLDTHEREGQNVIDQPR